MYCVDYFGNIKKVYGELLEYYISLGMFTTDNYILALNYSNATQEHNR